MDERNTRNKLIQNIFLISFNFWFFWEKHFLGNEEEEYARRRPGVYFRLERDLYSRKDQFGVEIRERAKWDIRESMVGTETFEPKHIAIATWKNVSFAGGITSASRIVSSIFFTNNSIFFYLSQNVNN